MTNLSAAAFDHLRRSLAAVSQMTNITINGLIIRILGG